MSKKVLVAESNAYLLETLANLLSTCGFAVLGMTSQPSEVASLSRSLKPDLLIYDLNLSDDGLAGLSHLQTLKKELPSLKILVTGFQDPTDVFVEAVIRNGCDAFCNKFDSRAGLMKTLHALVSP